MHDIIKSFYCFHTMQLCSPKISIPSPIVLSALSYPKYIDSALPLSSYFDSDEQRMLHDFQYDQRRRNFILSRLGTKLTISSLYATSPLDVHLSVGCFSQPVLSCSGNVPLDVTITHCRDFGMTAVFWNGLMLGIDLEKIQERISRVVFRKSCASEREILANTSLDDSVLSTVFWTAKEALAKALRTGYTVDMPLFSISDFSETSDYMTCHFTYFPQFVALSFPILDFMFSMVYPKTVQLDFSVEKLRADLFAVFA